MKRLSCYFGVVIMAASAFGEGEDFRPTSKEDLDAFYSTPERSVTVTLRPSGESHTVSPAFLGINLSYFNHTDEHWRKFGIREKLRKAGVGAMRYPGGEETSFFHWRHPGVNGYEDLWDDPSSHGMARGRGRFQMTWTPPKRWATNTDFMSFDEFMAECIAIGAEPVVGLNLSSGRRHNRQADGIKEALDWMRYGKEKGYKVTYWFMDNEPWHHEAAHTFTLEEYAEEVVAYGSAIRKEFPGAKLIANPASSSKLNGEQIEKFMRLAGEFTDYIDVHWYWAWGRASFGHWAENTPLTNDDKWKDPGEIRSYAEDIQLVREAAKRAGHPDVGIVALEWNVAPSELSQTFNQSLTAIIQAELLLEFARNDVRLTCLWPLMWMSSRDVWSEQDLFPSIITSDPPFNETLSLEMFRMLSAMPGKAIVATATSEKDVVTLAARGEGETVFYCVNKSRLRRRVTVEMEGPLNGTARAEMIGVRHQVVREAEVEREERRLRFFAEPYSFTAIRLTE